MVLRAREVMTDRVISVRPDTPAERARALLVERRFSALPVVDGHNHLVGVLDAADLVRLDHTPRGLPPHTVGGLMRRGVVCMSPESDIGVLTHRLRTYGEPQMMPIVEHGFLVGVITRADLLRPRPRDGKLGRLARRAANLLKGGGTAGRPRPPAAARKLNRTGTLHARDIMTSADLVTVTENTPPDHAARLLVGNRFTALPVVDVAGRLVGLVSEADLIDDPLNGRRTPRPRSVAAAMTTDVITRPPDAPVVELAQVLSDGGLRLVPIVAGDRLVGVVSRGDVLRAHGIPHSP
ncbi:CBS-domain-containing membrane protein [Pseudonocardia eucalypti]|nr:CBS-domain-containing membrane protein [Pseudonocardia eucalypti]